MIRLAIKRELGFGTYRIPGIVIDDLPFWFLKHPVPFRKRCRVAEQLNRALILYHPFGSLTLAGVKKIETLSWRPPKCLIGQRIIIYAGRPPALQPVSRIPRRSCPHPRPRPARTRT